MNYFFLILIKIHRSFPGQENLTSVSHSIQKLFELQITRLSMTQPKILPKIFVFHCLEQINLKTAIYEKCIL